MRATLLALALILGAAAASGARAGTAPCWFEHGALVVSAAAGDIADDYILDLSAPQSLLHDTRAEAAGLEGADVRLPLRLAGERLGDVDFGVEPLDDRTFDFPTNIAGVIGADALKGYVIDIAFRPCRVRLTRGRTAAIAGARGLRLAWIGNVPTLTAGVADGATARTGRFAIDTGGAGVRVAASEAAFSRPVPKDADPASRERPPARLRALSLAGALLQNLRAGVDPDLPQDVLGAVGTDVWQGYALRIDLSHDLLGMAPSAHCVLLEPPTPPQCHPGQAAKRRRSGIY